MLTTAVFGLLSQEQAFYATKMTQMVVNDDKNAKIDQESDSYSGSDSN